MKKDNSIKIPKNKPKTSKQDLDLFFSKVAKSGPMRSKTDTNRSREDIKKIALEEKDLSETNGVYTEQILSEIELWWGDYPPVSDIKQKKIEIKDKAREYLQILEEEIKDSKYEDSDQKPMINSWIKDIKKYLSTSH